MDAPKNIMMQFEQEEHSFVIRLWKEQHDDDAGWRGWIEHVQSEKRYYFQNQQALNHIFTQYIKQIPDLKTLFPGAKRE